MPASHGCWKLSEYAETGKEVILRNFRGLMCNASGNGAGLFSGRPVGYVLMVNSCIDPSRVSSSTCNSHYLVLKLYRGTKTKETGLFPSAWRKEP